MFSPPLLDLFIPLSLVLFPCSSLARREHAQNVTGFPLACVTARLRPLGLSNTSGSPHIMTLKKVLLGYIHFSFIILVRVCVVCSWL